MNHVKDMDWPNISHWELDEFYRGIRRNIIALEAAYEAGQLRPALAGTGVAEALGPRITQSYTGLLETPPGRLQRFRLTAIHSLLSQLREDLFAVKHLATAEVVERGPPRESSGPQDMPQPARPRIERVRARFEDGEDVLMDRRQVLAARFWGIGFDFQELESTDEIARSIARLSASKLASDISQLRTILLGRGPRTPGDSLAIAASPESRRFEHLILDILNETEHCARMAPLAEDFREKTDMRVSYPALRRRRGARVQVTQTTHQKWHDAKRSDIKAVEEFVFLSPRTLAEFLGSAPTPATPSDIGLHPRQAAAAWANFEGKPGCLDELAQGIKTVLLDALQLPWLDPRGPIAGVPSAIRVLVREFVRHEAFRSTDAIRHREATRGRLPREMRRSSSAVRRRASSPSCAQSVDLPRVALEDLRSGQTAAGIVTNLVDYGAFVDIGGIHGLLHISKIPNGSDAAVRARLSAGSRIDVLILQVDAERRRLSLGLPGTPLDDG